jgi:predicted AAA+ superfamily ATPase
VRRKFDDRLLRWKDAKDKTCLLVKGARQVGKTYSIESFGKSNYETYVYINFETDRDACRIFDGNLDADTVVMNLTAKFRDKRLMPGKTLIFLDEIQSCPNARVALKPLAIDGRFDVVASGSLLGLNFGKVSSFPVGYETVVDLNSMDFEEFLWALGYDESFVSNIRSAVVERRPMDEYLLKRMEELFRWHVIVGGMPEAVGKFAETGDFRQVYEIQKKITSGYLDDVTKYAVGREAKARSCFESIPAQLSKRNKKFVFGEVDGKSGAGVREYESGIRWLLDAGIINCCHNLQEPALPLAVNKRFNVFKIYMKDTGLLTSMMESNVPFALLKGDMAVNEGAIIENAAADAIAKHGYALTYFETKGTLEVDFVLNIGGVATALEVKSGDNTKSKSLSVVMDKHGVKKGMKFWRGNIGSEGDVECYPLFALAFIDDADAATPVADVGRMRSELATAFDQRD